MLNLPLACTGCSPHYATINLPRLVPSSPFHSALRTLSSPSSSIVSFRLVEYVGFDARYIGFGGWGVETRCSARPRLLLLAPRPTLKDKKSSKFGATANIHPSARGTIPESFWYTVRCSHSGCHRERAGRFSVMSPRLHEIRALSIAYGSHGLGSGHELHCSVSRTYGRSFIVRADDIEVALFKDYVRLISSGLHFP